MFVGEVKRERQSFLFNMLSIQDGINPRIIIYRCN